MRPPHSARKASGRTRLRFEPLEARNLLSVSSVDPTPSGVLLSFDAPIDTSAINLYDGEAHSLGSADVTLDGPSGPVKGSLLVNAVADQLEFVATGGPLAAGSYTLTLHGPDVPLGGSAAVYNFDVPALNSVVVSIPDFARAPGQPVDVPAFDGHVAHRGLPVYVTSAGDLASMVFDIAYDPALLSITDVFPGAGAPADLAIWASLTPGLATIRFSATAPLPAGNRQEILLLSAAVPGGAGYGAAQCIHIGNGILQAYATAEGGEPPPQLPATADHAVHAVMMLADANKNAHYDSDDARLIARVGLHVDSGFGAYPLIDPLLLGDATNDGTLSPIDAGQVSAEVAGMDSPYLPPPGGTQPNHAPVMHSQGDARLTALAEDPITNSGVLVRDLIASSVRPVALPVNMITDEDGGALEGLAVIAADARHGVWEFSLDDGATWSGLETVSETNARLLASDTTTRIRFLPAANFNGTLDPAITFRAWDQTAGVNGATADVSANGGTTAFSTGTETASITITAVNDPPVADSQSLTTAEDTSLAITLSGDDMDPLPTEVQALTFQLLDLPLHGTLTGFDAATGQVTYVPDHDYFGPDSFTFQVRDDGLAGLPIQLWSDPATVSITVTAVNDAPTLDAIADPAPIDEDAGPQIVSLAGVGAGGGADEVGQALTVTVTSSSPGLIPDPAVDYSSPNAAGILTCTPVANASGTAVITVTVTDDGGTANGGVNSTVRTFTVTVNAVNDEPGFEAADPLPVDEDAGEQTIPGWATFNPGPADESAQTVLQYIVSSVSNSALFAGGPTVDADGTLRYTPAANAFGTSTFTVAVQDSGGTLNGGVDTSAPQIFTITVNSVDDVDAYPDDYATNEDVALNVEASGVLANDQDAEGDALIAVLTVNPAHALEFFFNPDGSFAYQPKPDFFGVDTFRYQAFDGTKLSNETTVTITVNPVNDAPGFLAQDPPPVDEDAAAQTLFAWATFSPGPANESAQTALAYLVSGVSNPALFASGPAVDADGTLRYSPAANAFGTSTFTVAVQDSGGTLNGGVDISTSQTFTITVYAQPDPPEAFPDEYETGEDAVLIVEAPGVLINDVDPDGDPLAAVLVESPQHAANFTFSIDGSFAYEPEQDFFGTDTFRYRVLSGASSSDVTTVTITVASKNDAPSFQAENPPAVDEDSAAQTIPGWATFSPGLANESAQTVLQYIVSDVETPALFAAGPTVDAAGTLRYTPAADAFGTSTFAVAVQDSGGVLNGGVDTSTAQIFTIIVNSIGKPHALDDVYTVDRGGLLVVLKADGPLFNDVDPQGDPLAIAVIVDPPDHASFFSWSASGQFTYQPEAGFSGDDSFQYRASDGVTFSNIATVTIRVLPAAPSPSALEIPLADAILAAELPEYSAAALDPEAVDRVDLVRLLAGELGRLGALEDRPSCESDGLPQDLSCLPGSREIDFVLAEDRWREL